MTPNEFWSYYDAKVPKDRVNKANGLPTGFKPFTDEERELLEGIARKVDGDK